MFKEVLTKHNIRFQKKNRLKVLFYLPFLWLQEKIWHLKKRIRRVKKPVIHLYAVCWNEAKILPFMLDYYSQFVDHFYIYDNYSDDETDEILKSRDNITVYKFDTGGTFNDLVHQKIKNTVWKKSRGKADWVIVIDMDEALYHENFLDKLTKDKGKVSIYKSLGFDMVAESFPVPEIPIIETINRGVSNFWFNKSILFDPYRIIDMHYDVGCHNCYPEGIVRIEENGFKLLHYKNLGVDYVLNKIYSYRRRMSKENLENNWGIHYQEEDEKIITKIKEMLNNAQVII